jgi:DNA-directed RNA polymerase specialized sigma24 family protein
MHASLDQGVVELAESQSPAGRLASAGLASLLSRMRAGDREAAATFMHEYGARIRRRIRGKLTPAMRRLFDSQEILSTLGRRLDLYVRSRRLAAASEAQLWSLVFRVADNALIDRQRAFKRLRDAEAEDGPIARELLERMEAGAGAPGDGGECGGGGGRGGEAGVERFFDALPDPLDREILSLWFTDTPHTVTAQLLGMPDAAVRKHWQRIKELLRAAMQRGEL